MSKPLEIDFVSDVICPWCFIGLTRLEQALDAKEVKPTLRMRPFQLDPSTPPEGADLRERLAKKYGVDPEQMFGRVEAAAKESGIPLDFAKVRRTPNTLKAHALIDAAGPKGTQLALARALFAAYFLEGKDIGDSATLAAIGEGHGFTADEALAALEPERLAAVREEASSFSSQGITGVPFAIFEQKLAVSGAQPVAVFAKAIDEARKLSP